MHACMAVEGNVVGCTYVYVVHEEELLGINSVGPMGGFTLASHRAVTFVFL